MAGPQELAAPDPAQHGRQRFQRNDAGIAQVVKPLRLDGTVHDAVAGEGGVHQEHMVHKGKVGGVVGDIAKSHQGGKESHGQHHGGLGQTNHHSKLQT